MSEQEAKDLQEAKDKVNQLMASAFSGMRESLRMDEAQLRVSGHKTKEDAIIGYYKYYQKEIDKIWAAYLKKYPD